MWIDNHCHLPPADPAAVDELVAESRDAGVVGLVNVGTDVAGSRAAIEVARGRSGVWATSEVEALYRSAAGDKAGSIHVLPLMPAPALELPVTAARLGLDKSGTKDLDPMAQLALNATLKAGSKFGVKFDYIIFVTAEKAGAVGPVTNVDHYAAIYQPSTKRAIAAAKSTGTTTAETATEKLPVTARRVASLLLDGEIETSYL